MRSAALHPRAGRAWAAAEWALFTAWIAAALFDMFPAAPGGRVLVGSFLTTHAADLTLPAWLYVILRRRPSRGPLRRIVGRSAEATAALVLVASAATELSQLAWPDGPFRGVFDPLDLAAFTAGVAGCYLADKRFPVRPVGPAGGGPQPLA